MKKADGRRKSSIYYGDGPQGRARIHASPAERRGARSAAKQVKQSFEGPARGANFKPFFGLFPFWLWSNWPTYASLEHMSALVTRDSLQCQFCDQSF